MSTIEYVKKDKKVMEQSVLGLLRGFEIKHGLSIDDIDVHKNISILSVTTIVDVKIDIKLWKEDTASNVMGT